MSIISSDLFTSEEKFVINSLLENNENKNQIQIRNAVSILKKCLDGLNDYSKDLTSVHEKIKNMINELNEKL